LYPSSPRNSRLESREPRSRQGEFRGSLVLFRILARLDRGSAVFRGGIFLRVLVVVVAGVRYEEGGQNNDDSNNDGGQEADQGCIVIADVVPP